VSGTCLVSGISWHVAMMRQIYWKVQQTSCTLQPFIRYKYPGTWRCVVDLAVSDMVKDRRAFTLKMKALQSFEMSETARPTTQLSHPRRLESSKTPLSEHQNINHSLVICLRTRKFAPSSFRVNIINTCLTVCWFHYHFYCCNGLFVITCPASFAIKN
jgi:hypothetical protein